jgi:hypothetical protein
MSFMSNNPLENKLAADIVFTYSGFYPSQLKNNVNSRNGR